MTILVFGKTGQVANELQRQAEVMALGRDEANLANPEALGDIIADRAPKAVINAAAYTAVDKAESDERMALAVNALAPSAMARACASHGIPFLHISTDYVFSGEGTAAWRETDPVAPRNAYGRTKLMGEEGVRAAGGNAAILRTSWVFSAHGNNFVRTMLRLSETRDALNVVDDQIGGPTPAGDIAAALLQMARKMMAGHAGGTYHFGGAPWVSWADFAREIFAQAGREVAVSGIPTTDYPTPATRPLNSRMDCSAISRDFGIATPDWKAGLAKVIKELDL